MLYTEDTRIEALAVHVVGNKSKDEPLTVSPELSAQVADEGLMRTLTAYFLGGFKSEECYNPTTRPTSGATRSGTSHAGSSTIRRRSSNIR